MTDLQVVIRLFLRAMSTDHKPCDVLKRVEILSYIWMTFNSEPYFSEDFYQVQA